MVDKKRKLRIKKIFKKSTTTPKGYHVKQQLQVKLPSQAPENKTNVLTGGYDSKKRPGWEDWTR